MKLFFALFVGLLLGSIATFISWKQDYLIPTHNQLSKVLSAKNVKRQVIGFLPYWNLKSIGDIPFDKLTTIHYFAIDIDGEGNINKSDGGWQKMDSQNYKDLKTRLVAFPNIRSGVTFVSLDANNIARIVNNETRRTKLIKNIISLMKEEKFDDLNFDFEYYGDLDKNTVENYTKLTKTIVDEVHKNIPGSIVSIDVYADSVAKPRIFEIAKLGQIVDQIVIMGYDFHRINSVNAGPIAPLFGKEKYEYEIYQSIVDFLKVVPNEKLILAVPFYGYEWPTVGPEIGSFVVKSSRNPEISSYKRSISTAKENNVAVNFDDESKSAWYSYFDNDSGTFRQVWFENERSLGLKFDLVNQGNLGGIGIWALGYDGPESGLLWQTVQDKFQ